MIEKIAKRLKRFTLKEFELIVGVECDDIIAEMVENGNSKFVENIMNTLNPKLRILELLLLIMLCKVKLL